LSNLILIADDDEQLLDTVVFLLKDSGYRTSVATNKNEILSQLKAETFDLMLLDVELGSDNGFEIALEVRKSSTVPIIMLTGRRAETDRVVGLELGADDYITKPFGTAELLARINAVLRRSNITKETSDVRDKNIAKFGNWVCDINRRSLSLNDSNSIKLSSGEFAMLVALLKNCGRTMSRQQLLDATGSEDSFDRSIDIQIMRLRRKLGDGPNSDQLIQSVRSIGYIFAAKVEWS